MQQVQAAQDVQSGKSVVHEDGPSLATMTKEVMLLAACCLLLAACCLL